VGATKRIHSNWCCEDTTGKLILYNLSLHIAKFCTTFTRNLARLKLVVGFRAILRNRSVLGVACLWSTVNLLRLHRPVLGKLEILRVHEICLLKVSILRMRNVHAAVRVGGNHGDGMYRWMRNATRLGCSVDVIYWRRYLIRSVNERSWLHLLGRFWAFVFGCRGSKGDWHKRGEMPHCIELSFGRASCSCRRNCAVVIQMGPHFFGTMGKQTARSVGAFLSGLPVFAHLCLISHGIHGNIFLNFGVLFIFLPLDRTCPTGCRS